MNIDYRRLRAAVRLADERSFSRAAERLHISQPALSGQIKTLENDLGFEVFRRSTRNVELTRNGERFIDESRRLLAESERLERFVASVQRQEQTQLLIAAPIYTIDFPDRIRYLESLVEESADTRVEIVTRASQTEIALELAAGQLDLAILMGVPIAGSEYSHALSTGAGRESVFDASLRTVVLAEQAVDLLVPADSSLARRRSVTARDLAGQRVAVPDPYHGAALYQRIEQFLLDAGAKLVHPPEPNAIGVERYGRRIGIPAITLGWFPQPREGGMVRRPLTGLDLRTQLVVAGHPEVSTPAIERAYALARQSGSPPIP
jgi:DNA-binding transcriptional LysR family regulator